MSSVMARSRKHLERTLHLALVVAMACVFQVPRMVNAAAVHVKIDLSNQVSPGNFTADRSVRLTDGRSDRKTLPKIDPAGIHPAGVDQASALTLTATVSPTTAYASGADPMTVTASLTGFVGSGAGSVISFTTDLGTLSSPTATTNVSGVVEIQLTSVISGLATITATADTTATSSVTATFIPALSPQIAKYALPTAGSRVARGSIISYTIVVTAPPGNLANLVITDTIPANTSYISGSKSGTGVVSGPDPVTMTQAFVAAGSTATLTFRVAVTTGVTTTTEITNVASISTATSSPTSTAPITHVVSIPAQVAVSVLTDTQVAGGAPTTVTASVTDGAGNPIFGESVSGLISPTARGTLSPFGQTNESGQTFAIWTPGTVSGNGVITASVGAISGTAAITVTPGPVSSVDVGASPDLIVANGVSTTTVTATLRDQFGNLTPSAPVTLSTNLGTLAPVTATTNVSGVVTATLTSAASIGVATVQASSGGQTGTTTVRFGVAPGQFTAVLTTSTLITTGNLLTYTFVLTNNGAVTQTNVGMIAAIPAETTFISVSGGVYGGGLERSRRIKPAATDVNAVSWTGTLAPGESHTIIYTVRVTKLFGPLTATAQGVVDAVEIFSSGPVTTTVVPAVQLRLSQVLNQTPFE